MSCSTYTLSASADKAAWSRSDTSGDTGAPALSARCTATGTGAAIEKRAAMVEQPLILLNNTDKQPLSIFLSQINTGEIGLAFAMATVYMIPSLLLFLHGEEYLVEGIANSGSVKG